VDALLAPGEAPAVEIACGHHRCRRDLVAEVTPIPALPVRRGFFFDR
jgi:hypothetical protein